ncbi:hypothetical protein [Wolbachia endosymbiont (group A) of Yponomeuta plumbellus]|uniref:hypothetical protein n=1 Tax=Wolbachia endosymbiont (group A) of Yponomeuta plumbellus TaxID=2954068 RepID=UPI00222F3058|nr:hypothetical protein [Wolbachia endosymbiont (group A) of Yponomeuta plumbellus]
MMDRENLLYSVLYNVLYKVDKDNGLDTSNIIKKIKERLESGMRTSSKENYYEYLYASWEKKVLILITNLI